MKKKEGFVPPYMKLPLFATLACNFFAYNGSRLFTFGRFHYDLTSCLDRQIPFIPWTVAIYLGCYLFWVLNYVAGCWQGREEAFRFISADFLAKVVCLACFILFPTTNTRPPVAGDSVWDALVRVVYRLDAADNLFPSIHCLTSWFCYIAVRGNEKIPRWYRRASLAFAFMVFVSTLTTKQHVLVDVAGGVVLAEWSYHFVKKSGFAGLYERTMARMARKAWNCKKGLQRTQRDNDNFKK